MMKLTPSGHAARRERPATRLGAIALACALLSLVAVVLAAGSAAAATPHAVHAQAILTGSDAHLANGAITTTHSLTGTLGQSGWFVSAVTVTLTVENDESPILGTVYRLDTGDWLTYTVPFSVASDGNHTLDYYSIALDGAREPTRTAELRIDATAPSSAVNLLPAYHDTVSFTVAWSGNDNTGSGIASYDVEYKDGADSAWRRWFTGTTSTSAVYTGAQRGHVYYFQSRARDIAGNSETFPGGRGDTSTFVNSVVNGGFETGDFSGWTVTGEMSKSITLAVLVNGYGQWSATLGSPAYGNAITPTQQMHVPTNTVASISQTIVVPPLSDMPAPALRLWYRIQTYDVVWGCSEPDKLYDSFDVTVRDGSRASASLLLRAGNFDCETWTAYYDTHGHVPPLTLLTAEQSLDLTPYAGRVVVIEMYTANRLTWDLNTWTSVDDIRIVNHPIKAYRVFLPVTALNNSMTLTPPAAPRAPAGDAPRPR
jgi:hypothetical protein